MTPEEDLVRAVVCLLERGGFVTHDLSIEPIKGGGNNRLYRVGSAGKSLLVKQYFRHPGDDRDRLKAEFDFLRYAAQAAPSLCPIPYACNPEANLALYEFVNGRPLKPDEIGESEVMGAIEFIRSLNKGRSTARLPDAADACFSIDDHLTLVGTRVKQLVPELTRSTEAVDVAHRLDTAWRAIEEGAQDAIPTLERGTRLPLAQRIVSPSDFGFHNALRGANGQLHFLDFEYAGWDDPAKTAGDFFHQLAIPVPSELFSQFVKGIVPDTGNVVQDIGRAAALKPVYGIKWCCIALNVFHPIHLARRRFANPGLDEQELKRNQLGKAARLLDTLESTLNFEESTWLTST